MSLLPFLLILAAILEALVLDLQKLELLQVRVGNPPAPSQVEIEPVT